MLVVGILSSIAVPSFLGARNNAYDKEAQASIDATLLAAETHYAQYGDFSDAMTDDCIGSTLLPGDLQKQDPTIDMVTAATPSSGPRMVSVQTGETWNSNGESLGCQAFYATALSRSGTCWVARLTVEGKYLVTGSVSPIIVKSDKNTAALGQVELTGAALNGKAYASIKPTQSGADGAAAPLADLADAKLACSGAMQGTGVLATGVNTIASTEFYSSWRSVVGAVAGSTAS